MKAKTMYAPGAAGQRCHDASDVGYLSCGGPTSFSCRCQSQFIVAEAAFGRVYVYREISVARREEIQSRDADEHADAI